MGVWKKIRPKDNGKDLKKVQSEKPDNTGLTATEQEALCGLKNGWGGFFLCVYSSLQRKGMVTINRKVEMTEQGQQWVNTRK